MWELTCTGGDVCNGAGVIIQDTVMPRSRVRLFKQSVDMLIVHNKSKVRESRTYGGGGRRDLRRKSEDFSLCVFGSGDEGL